MRLDRLNVDLRPRGSGQAADTGIHMLRAHWRTTFAAWWCIWLPLAVLCGIWPGAVSNGWGALALWLCKPLAERMPVFVLSRAIFSEPPTLPECLRAWPGQIRPGLIANLTIWRVISIGRAFMLPIWQLEGLTGRDAAQRRKDLGGKGTERAASWLGAWCAQFETLLAINLMALYALLNPVLQGAGLDGRGFLGWFTFNTWPGYLSIVIAGGIIGPVYVSGCFALYLNRRSTLEGWDLELGLRRLADRLQSHGQTGADPRGARKHTVTMLLLGAVLASTFLITPRPVLAAAPAADARAAQAYIRQTASAVVHAPPFEVYRTTTHWALNDTGTHPKPTPAPTPHFGAPEINESQAALIKYMLIGLLVVGLLYLLYRTRHLWPDRFDTPQVAFEPARRIGGLDVRPESLPADLAREVETLWQQQRQREAMALLYRGTLTGAINRYALPLRESDTESDCLLQARRTLASPVFTGFDTITRAWQQSAWGGIWPSSQEVSRLCQTWQQHFALRGDA
ncbi:hypothetical protein HNQ50_003664 [Silvimonas terrae]|uniref:DUF4129 domain-containing protein n=1 Tax=Silvimonas terrae TaxID=300266 RepID=A0A840RKA8_9NEIS|nr:hypothetical protein [Silvimonas terrae]MBB5192910.1 hypothetical protein [Silvimonas terrae]